MGGFKQVILFASLFQEIFADSCTAPNLPNGDITGSGDGSTWTGSLSCHPGFTLVGSNLLKCRGGQWSSSIPVCTAIGRCDAVLLPDIKYGRKVPYQSNTFRGAVYKYSCRRGFRRFGNSLVHCTGDSWALDKLPICSRPGCDESIVKDIKNGQSMRKAHGGVYVFRCDEDTVLEGSSVLTCDGKHWNSTAPTCLSPTLSPSINLEIDGVPTSEVVAGMQVTITCHGEGGSPTPALSILLSEEEVAQTKEGGLGVLSYTFAAKSEQNSIVASCTAINSAMQHPLVTEKVLNVKYGPKKVSLGGPDSLVQGHVGGFECYSSASNPPPEIQWRLTDHSGRDITHFLKISDLTTSWIGHGWDATSTATFQTDADVNSLHVTCRSVNPEILQKVEDTIHVSMQFAPEKVTITGPQKVVLGAMLRLECFSSPSVPATSLTWSVAMAKEILEHNAEEDVEQLSDGSFVTRSRLMIEVNSDSDLVVECYGNNKVLGKDSRAYAHIVEILSSPGSPKISSLSPLSDSGLHELVCASSPLGNPPATLAWYDGSELMESHYQVEGDVASAKITFVPSNEYRELTCQASSSTLSEPIRNTIKLDVTTSKLEPTASAIVNTSSTTITYEYDEEDEDDQMDYYADYNDTDNVALVDDNFIIQNIQNEGKLNETGQSEKKQAVDRKEFTEYDAADAAKYQDEHTKEDENITELIENIEDSKEVEEPDAVTTTEHDNITFAPSTGAVTDIGERQHANTSVNSTKAIKNMTIKARQTMNSGNQLNSYVLASLLCSLCLLKIIK